MKKTLIVVLLLATAWTVAAFAREAASLPDYRAREQVSGTIRSRGNDQMGALMKRWERGFRKLHPDVRFEDTLKGSASGIYGLEMRTADIALMGRPINPYERYGTYERAWVYPVEIEVATGSHAIPHKSPAYAIFVHKDNPLAKLTLRQLDDIFGAQRRGGWNALTWDESAARGAEDNIRTWGQLGLREEWAGKAIHVYGPPNLGTGTTTFFQSRAMGGGEIFNEDLREYADRKQMIADLEKDPQGIAYGALGYRTPGVKALALASTSAGPFVEITPGTIAARTYPLARPVYVYYTIDNAKTELADPRVDPRVREFLRYILSRQGQQEVVREGSYLPLTPAVAIEQMRKLDSNEIPPERKLLKDE